jgi:ACS family hexuronate transporter-like MFS transporter
MSRERLSGELSGERSPAWKWTVCGLLLLATMLNYMDRQTLGQLATTIQGEFHLDDEQYGELEMGFGLAFAAGALFFGYLVDRLGALWIYPAVLLGWSAAGIATAYGDAIGQSLLTWSGAYAEPEAARSQAAYLGLMTCRVVLGFFEAGHWPCALVTAQTILSRQDRSFGNSILQSGAALGAIITPVIIISMLPAERPGEPMPAGVWRPPFVAIGAVGLLWIIPWLMLVRGRDLEREPQPLAPEPAAADESRDVPLPFWRPFLVLVIIVVTINFTWQFFRAWLPKFLEEQRGYSKAEVAWFVSAYYVATDVGCVSVGYAVRWLAGRGWSVHGARLATFAVCTSMTLLSLAAAVLPPGPLLVGVLLLIGAGALGLFPNHYAFTQELSKTHQGKIVGLLGTIAWVTTSPLQKVVGAYIKEHGTYTGPITMAGLAPVLGLLALWLLWPRRAQAKEAA